MRFTLKDYQRDAVVQTLDNLTRARKLYVNDNAESSFSLTAVTGAGKTVMAAAAIESLFYGDTELGFDADPGAVVIWFSDNPDLNEQTKTRLNQASEKLSLDRLITIKPPFSVPRLEPRHVYFLNTQRLSKTSTLTRGAERTAQADALGEEYVPSPDDLAWNIWQTLANTIEDDSLTVYFILDEAHRGFAAKASREKPTIVRSLVDGDRTGLPMPIVWGISATIEHFDQAMKNTDTRRHLPPVTVDPSRVLESGLLKDIVALDIPAEAGNLETTLTTRAARLLKDSQRRWNEYVAEQRALPGETVTDRVVPLLVLQIPNTEDPDDVGRWLNLVQAELGDLAQFNVRHVLGDHKTKTFGSWEVDHIDPQAVQGNNDVRVLIAKDGISTGWDCPRAEVLVSFRPAKDHTHITQLLGRMVRTPLARRIPGNDRLNAVDCILPHFDRTTAGNVVKYLTGLIEDMPTAGPKAVLNPRDLEPNQSLDERVWDAWDALVSQVVPRRGARAVTRLMSFAQALSADGLKSRAISRAQRRIHTRLEEFAEAHDGDLQRAEIEVKTVRGMRIQGARGGDKLSYVDFAERADENAVRVAFEDAQRAFGPDIANSYVDYLMEHADEEDDDALRRAYVKVAALATVPHVRERVDRVATELVDEWFEDNRVAMKGLADERREAYADIRAQAVEPQVTPLERPKKRIEDFSEIDKATDQVRDAELIEKHLMSDEDGWFPMSSLGGWERDVIRTEVVRPDCVAWYRNPSVPRPDSLGIAYRDDRGNWRRLHPDFVIFSEVRGEIRPSIVDPHGGHLEDSMVKLRGMAKFAEAHGTAFHRIDSIATNGVTSQLRVLDMLDPEVRATVLAFTGTVNELFDSSVSAVYK
ncbi:DEAD/DEAH box helicase family protein [Microbacterium sp.]|uniref:DEAD/DEAH box helicase n=1 Tax=Microbacterium sp. TaxID=51671 RepID=UPI0028A910EC|nr:DEAD/DEAH box helicase family protein [Microbacterium sp.]